MSLNKSISQLKLETTANYQAKSKLNVRFFQQDLNTAELKFLITRDNFPLSLSSENVVIIIAMQQGRNFISSDEFIVSSEIDGVCSFMIPNDFLSSVSGTVEAQVYVGTLDNDQVVVQRPFTFEVSNDLLSSIPSELKLQYIKTFSDLRNEITDTVQDLQDEIATLGDYVDTVNQATIDGLAQLNALVDSKTIEYNDNHADKLALINNTVGDYVADFLDQRTYIDTKYTEFQTAVQGSGLVTTASTTNWQKSKLTNDDGRVAQLNGFDFNNPEATFGDKSQFAYISSGLNPPFAGGTNGTLNYIVVTSAYKRMEYRPNGSNRIFYRRKEADVWQSWSEGALIDPSNPFETTLGAQGKANTAENNAKTYVDSEIADQHTILFEGSVNGTGNTANLSGNMNDYQYIIISGDCSGNDFSNVVVPHVVGSILNIQNMNLRDSDGMLLGVYECRLELTNTSIKITNDVAYDNPSGTGSGPDRNAYTITRVDGVTRI